MADNITLDPGSGGATLAADDISSVFYQRVKVTFGADGSATDVSDSAPLPVEIGDGTNQAGVDGSGNLQVIAAANSGVDIGDVDVLTIPLATNGAASGSLNAANAAVTLSAEGAGSINWEIDTGTLSGTVVFEATLDDTNWFAIDAIQIDGTIITSTSSFADRGALTSVGYSQVRLRVSAYTSGASNARLETSAATGVVRLGDALPAGSNTIGAVTNTTLSVVGGGTEATALRVTLANDSTGVVSIDDGGNVISVDWNGTAPPIGAGVEATALRVTVATDSTGVLSVDDNGSSLTVDNGGTFAVQEDGAALTALQLIDDIVYTDDTSTHTTAVSKGALMMAAATPTDTAVDANDIGALAMSLDRRLLVDADITASVALDVSAAVVSVDWNGTAPPIGAGTEAAALRVTVATDSTGVLSVDDNGASLTVDNGGTFAVQEDGAALTALQLIDDIVYIDDTATHATGSSKGALMMAAATPTDTVVDANDIGALAMSLDRRLLVDAQIAGQDAALDVSGATVTVTDNGSFTLAANSGVDIGDVDVTSIIPGTGATNLGKAEDAAHGDGDTGVMLLAVRRDADTTMVTADNDYSPLQVNANGALKVEIFDGGDSHTVDGTITASNTSGDVAHDTADSGNPVKIGAVARTTHPTAVGDADRVNVYADDLGRLVVSPHVPRDRIVHNRIALTTTTETSLIAAGGAGVFRDIIGLIISNESASETRVDIADGASIGTTTVRLSLDLAADGGGGVIMLPVPLTMGTANHLWSAQLSGAASTIYVTAIAIENN